jgi:hypothetical protein
MNPFRRSLILGVVCACALGCGGSDSSPSDGTGGQNGGGAGTGGASTGGSAGTGGASTGGSAGTGGASTGGSAGTGGGAGSCTASSTFSFFVMSLESIKKLSGSEEGFGGDLDGLSGADDKCQKTAESVGSCGKTWHAFLSATDDGSGNAVNAIDRVGAGPWYDVNGHKLADNINGLLGDRPNGDNTIVYTDGFSEWGFKNCLTTELGNCTLSYTDSHDTLTGSDRSGKLYSTDMKYTCNNWTSTNVNVQLPIGHSWPRHLTSTDSGETNWLYAHTNCSGGGQPGGNTCNGCAANINLNETFEEGVGGDGGYGAWYCFAID